MGRVNKNPYRIRPSRHLIHMDDTFNSLFGMNERLTELVCGYEELFDMTNGIYSDKCHKDKIWRVFGVELNKKCEMMCNLIAGSQSCLDILNY